MAKDFGEMAREFIAGLKEDTGRDLAEWMDAIGAQRFTNKNDAIDWLRGLVMVLMALVTTFLTGPLLNLAERAKRWSAPATSLT